MNKEKLTVSLTEDEFVRFVLCDALGDEGVEKYKGGLTCQRTL